MCQEVESLSSSSRSLVKRSASFDIRSRPFGYKRSESADTNDENEAPVRRVKRMKSFAESPVSVTLIQTWIEITVVLKCVLL